MIVDIKFVATLMNKIFKATWSALGVVEWNYIYYKKKTFWYESWTRWFIIDLTRANERPLIFNIKFILNFK